VCNYCWVCWDVSAQGPGTHTCGWEWGIAKEPKIWDHAALPPRAKHVTYSQNGRVRRIFEDHRTTEWVGFGLEGSFEDHDL